MNSLHESSGVAGRERERLWRLWWCGFVPQCGPGRLLFIAPTAMKLSTPNQPLRRWGEGGRSAKRLSAAPYSLPDFDQSQTNRAKLCLLRQKLSAQEVRPLAYAAHG